MDQLVDTKPLHVWLDDPAVVAALRRLAIEQERSLKGMVQVAVREWVARHMEEEAA